MKSLKLFVTLFVAMFAMVACEQKGLGDLITDGNDDNNNDSTATVVKGTQENPYTVAEAKKNQDSGNQWVEGYIVGVYNFDAEEQFVFDPSGFAEVKSNILMADAAGETSKYIAVQLLTNDIRDILNLIDNPTNLGKKVKVYGSLEKYCGIEGVKGVIKAEVDGQLIDCEVVAGEATPITVVEFINKPVDANVWYELTGVISGSINTTYGNFDLVDETGSVYVYGLTATPQSVNDKSYASLGLEAGDKIKIRGTRGDYNGKVEVLNAYFVELVEKGAGEPEQPENPENPEVGDVTAITVAEFLTKPVDANVWYELTGVISGSINTTYGNFDLVDETGSVYVYGLKENKDASNTSFANLGLAAGDKIKIHGTRGEYNGKIEVMNAYFVELVEKGAGEPEQDQPDLPTEGEAGSETDPYTIDEAFANQGAKNNGVYVWIEGYIVGFVDGMNFPDNMVWGTEGETLTNIVIAASADEKDVTKCVPVQLPKGAIREGLNVVANPTNLGKAIKLQGTLEPYFGKAGIKNTKKAYLDGVEVK